MAFKNHSQIEELKLSERVLWNKRVGRKKGNPLGIETPLGHSYSMILEELASENLDSTPNPGEFLQHIKDGLILRGNAYESRRTTFETPCFSSSYTYPIKTYMEMKGLSQKAQAKIMKEILGVDAGY
ncbi:hypothetical protein HYW20_03255 [Candidatus Woesearchaeota archaeon]|nr:hypothetical protein [Candidatus Woesearchaeota archaeon]